jgi:cytochrome c-type biogenesis protein CcmH/NrfF
VACVALLALSFVVPVVAGESEEAIDRRTQEITRTTMSPFCPGRTLDSCPSPSAADWRVDVRHWVAAGVSTEEIRERLRKRVPDVDITGAPSTALDAVLPVAVTLVAIALLFLLLKALLGRRRSAAKDTTAETSDADVDRRIDEELERLDE